MWWCVLTFIIFVYFVIWSYEMCSSCDKNWSNITTTLSTAPTILYATFGIVSLVPINVACLWLISMQVGVRVPGWCLQRLNRQEEFVCSTMVAPLWWCFFVQFCNEAVNLECEKRGANYWRPWNPCCSYLDSDSVYMIDGIEFCYNFIQSHPGWAPCW